MLGHSVELIFFEAREEVLVRRFSDSRRPHPLLPHLPVLEGVRFEKERLADLRRHADRIIDTSDLTVHELQSCGQAVQAGGRISAVDHFAGDIWLQVRRAYDIDLLFDVRFLRNPFFVPDLKPLTGEDPRVRNYVLTDPDAVAFIGQLEGLFKFLIPLFERERRSYVNVAGWPTSPPCTRSG